MMGRMRVRVERVRVNLVVRVVAIQAVKGVAAVVRGVNIMTRTAREVTAVQRAVLMSRRMDHQMGHQMMVPPRNVTC